MKQQNRIHDFIKAQLAEAVNKGKNSVVFGASPNSTDGTNEYKCQNYATLACSSNSVECENHGVCSFSSNEYKCSSLEKPNFNMTTGCGTNLTTLCNTNTLC